MNPAEKIVRLLSGCRFNLDHEKKTQVQMEELFRAKRVRFKREASLDGWGTIDFLLSGGIGIEVKLKGRQISIYRQLTQYSESDKIKQLILVTNRAVVMPTTTPNNKPLSVFSLGKAWL